MFLLDQTLSSLVPFLSWSPPDTLCSQKSLADTPDVVAHTCNRNTLEAEASVCQTTERANMEPGVWLAPTIPALQGHPWPNSEVEVSQGYRRSCPKRRHTGMGRAYRSPLPLGRVLGVGCSAAIWMGKRSLARPKFDC